MSINPPSDIVLDVWRAADPGSVRAGIMKLGGNAVNDPASTWTTTVEDAPEGGNWFARNLGWGGILGGFSIFGEKVGTAVIDPASPEADAILPSTPKALENIGLPSLDIEEWFSRGAIIALGLIFVAAGLFMFGRN